MSHKINRKFRSLHGSITTVFLISFIVFISISASSLLIVFNYQMGRYTKFVGSQYAVQLARVLDVYYSSKNSWEDVGEWLYQNFAPKKGQKLVKKGLQADEKRLVLGESQVAFFQEFEQPEKGIFWPKFARYKFFYPREKDFERRLSPPPKNFHFYFLAEQGSQNLMLSDKLLGKEYLDSTLLSFCLVDPFCSFGESQNYIRVNRKSQFDLWFETFFEKKATKLDEKFLREKGLTSWVSSENRPELFANEQSEGFFARLPLPYIRMQDRDQQMFVLLDTEGKFITSNLPKEALVQKLGSTWNRLEKYVARYNGEANHSREERSFLGLGTNLADDKNVFTIRDKNENPVGFLYAESIVSPVWRTINQEVNSVILKVVLFSSLAIILIYWFIGRFYLSKLFVPLHSLSRVAAEVRRGNTRARVQKLPKETELALVTEQFNKMLDSLAHEETLREQQCRDVAHELRTPITIISGELQMIEEGVYRADEEKIRGLLGQVQQMQRLVNDLDILYNVDGGKENTLDFTDLDGAELLQQAYSAFLTQMKQKGIHFTLRLDFEAACVYGNASRLHQVFSNFLVNAMRYTPEGEHIELAGSLGKIEQGLGAEYVVFSVEDTGCGIPEEKRKFVFERFFRVDDHRNCQSGGRGLGLAISKSFVGLHNGIIWVEESRKGGAKFCFALPRLMI